MRFENINIYDIKRNADYTKTFIQNMTVNHNNLLNENQLKFITTDSILLFYESKQIFYYYFVPITRPSHALKNYANIYTFFKTFWEKIMSSRSQK